MDQPTRGFVPEPNTGRGTVGLIWSCVLTTFLCTYSAIHLDVPCGRTKRPNGREKLYYWIGRKAKWVAIGILSPEWITLLAFQQWFLARSILKTLRSKTGWEDVSMLQVQFMMMGGIWIQVPNSGQSHDSNQSGEIDLERSDGTAARVNSDNWEDAIKIPGFLEQFPSEDHVADKTKADFLAKLITCAQILWFLTQALARRFEGKTVSLLEISTVSYICLAIFTFLFWLNKPYDVNMPTILHLQHGGLENSTQYPNWDRQPSNETGGQFMASCAVFAALFSGIHCAAWDYPFPSLPEAWLWRVCAILVFVLPLVIAYASQLTVETPMGTVTLATVLYIAVRLYLLVEAFLVFRSSPESVYDQLDWPQYWGHFGS